MYYTRNIITHNEFSEQIRKIHNIWHLQFKCADKESLKYLTSLTLRSNVNCFFKGINYVFGCFTMLGKTEYEYFSWKFMCLEYTKIICKNRVENV